MTATQRFIEDAIKGGWDKEQYFGLGAAEGMPIDATEKELEYWLIGDKTIWIDPHAWRAVSKTRNWNAGKRAECPTCTPGKVSVDWRYYLHLFIEYIAMGRTIDEALTAIEQATT
jgi:hypothetical protein